MNKYTVACCVWLAVGVTSIFNPVAGVVMSFFAFISTIVILD